MSTSTPALAQKTSVWQSRKACMPMHAPRTAQRRPAGRALATQAVAKPLNPARTPPLTGAGAVLEPAHAKINQKAKIRVAVLGSGWGAVSFLRHLDPKDFGENGPYELVLISPRNYFLFTPLLASAMAGTVEERSLVTPIRNLIHGKGTFYEAACIDINPKSNVLTCQGTESGRLFAIPYDILLLSVGSVNNTFDIKGVEEHCWFMKTMEDAHKLRLHISKRIEQAGLPDTSLEERRRLLNFVVVGGGPTGVEVAAELHDLVSEDVARLFPSIKDDVQITLVDCLDKVLSSFHSGVSQYAGKLLRREGVELRLGTTVQGVTADSIRIKSKDGSVEDLPYGTCVWATGIAAHPLVTSLKGRLGAEAQGDPRGLLVDHYLRVKGTGGSIVALGDAAITNQGKAVEHAAALFADGDGDGDGRLSKKELATALGWAHGQFPQLGDLALQLDGGLMGAAAQLLFPNPAAKVVYAKHKAAIESGLDLEAFRQLLADADATARPLPPTAQVARQQGEYLAALFSHKLVQRAPAGAREASSVEFGKKASPFMYIHLGSLAYLGMNRAVMQLPTPFPVSSLKGFIAAYIWRALELMMQVSARNQWMLSNDWLRTKFFGRNLGDV